MFKKEIQINLVRDPYKARFQTCVMSSLLRVNPPQDQTLSMWVILTHMSDMELGIEVCGAPCGQYCA
jgi:hypothetical protein